MEGGHVILTAAGFYNPEVLDYVSALFPLKESVRVAIVTTAADGKENNKYSQLAKSQFKSVGFESVDFVDLENNAHVSFDSYNIIYVCGGNTFKLMKFAQEADFAESVKKLLKRGGVYIGVSAGSVITGSSIQIATDLSPDPNDVGLIDMKGMSITDKIIYPHYEERDEEEVRQFEKGHGVTVMRLNNNQALIIHSNEQKIIG